ncbi:flagellin [Mycobacterium sp.]|uniref:flagellin N-terminal helical domain-containing protein n=1 Tax=Mycobacterium sp. TaxID=1785 RepID=UPI002CF37AC9|nr:flagellin [Mycobacterium sp.]HTH91372.1 flagellin [Mycobacterium sp.]
MSDITLSAGIRQNLLSLQQTADLMATTQNRLATGKKVNSALDNPVSYFTSQSLGNRASDLSSLLDSIGNATQTIQAANNGLTSLTKLVQSAQAIGQQALQSASTSAKVTGTNTTALTAATVHAFTATKTLTVDDGTTTATYTAAAGDTVQDVLDAINGTASLNITASLNSAGKIVLENNAGGDIVVGGTGSAADLTTLGLTAGTTTGAENTTRTSLATQFDDIRTQIDQLAADSGYNGVNLLNGDDLTVKFNETGTSTLAISGVKYNSAGLGVAASTHTFQTDTDVNAALTNLGTALSSLRSQAAAFGSSLSVVQTRQDFTKAMVNTLQTGADNLVLADSNLEGANMLALQTRQSLSTTALSLAAQASQSVLRLFG